MKSVYLLAEIAGTRVAIESTAIESVVVVQEAFPVPKADPSIAGLFALRSRVLTLIDTHYLVTGDARGFTNGMFAVIAEIASHHYGLLVEKVFDVVTIEAEIGGSQIKPAAQWESLACGTVEVDGQLVLLLNLENMVGGRKLLAA